MRVCAGDQGGCGAAADAPRAVRRHWDKAAKGGAGSASKSGSWGASRGLGLRSISPRSMATAPVECTCCVHLPAATLPHPARTGSCLRGPTPARRCRGSSPPLPSVFLLPLQLTPPAAALLPLSGCHPVRGARHRQDAAGQGGRQLHLRHVPPSGASLGGGQPCGAGHGPACQPAGRG